MARRIRASRLRRAAAGGVAAATDGRRVGGEGVEGSPLEPAHFRAGSTIGCFP